VIRDRVSLSLSMLRCLQTISVRGLWRNAATGGGGDYPTKSRPVERRREKRGAFLDTTISNLDHNEDNEEEDITPTFTKDNNGLWQFISLQT